MEFYSLFVFLLGKKDEKRRKWKVLSSFKFISVSARFYLCQTIYLSFLKLFAQQRFKLSKTFTLARRHFHFSSTLRHVIEQDDYQMDYRTVKLFFCWLSQTRTTSQCNKKTFLIQKVLLSPRFDFFFHLQKFALSSTWSSFNVETWNRFSSIRSESLCQSALASLLTKFFHLFIFRWKSELFRSIRHRFRTFETQLRVATIIEVRKMCESIFPFQWKVGCVGTACQWKMFFTCVEQ